MQWESIDCIHYQDETDNELPYCKLKGEYSPECFICDCPEIIGQKKNGGENEMAQQTFKTTDYGDMTLAQIEPGGIEFLLKSIEKVDGQWGEYVVLIGSMNGEPYEIRAGGRAGKLFITEEKKLLGKVVKIVPSGTGMQRTYDVTATG